MSLRGWVSDFALGVRLAVGGGRTSWARLALSTLGIAIAAAVLLVAASVGTMHGNREARKAADATIDMPVAGVHPTLTNRKSTDFRGERVALNYVAPTAPDSPKPAALPALPKPGEMYASPALAAVLASDDGELLRPRVPEKIVGEIPQELVATPTDLIAWIGVDPQVMDAQRDALEVYGFGDGPTSNDLAAPLLALLLVGAVVLLLPVLIFITSASRIAGAERDRRLSALRLVGSGSRQVRRIAAAESLVGAVAGLVLGTLVFLVVRQFADDVSLFGMDVYVSDVVPDPALAVLVVLLIPVIAVLTALVALRRTIIEPLGVVRQSKPVKRHVWWRLAIVVLGVVLMTTQLGAEENTDPWAWAVTGGAAMLLVGVPILLPWVVERVAGRLSGGPSSWLLAIRRLQLDSGTSARVVGGVAVVLAGAIALQTVLLSVEGELGITNDADAPPPAVEVSAPTSLQDTLTSELTATPGVRKVLPVQGISAYEKGKRDSVWGMAVLDCAAMRELAGVRGCADGDVFMVRDQYQPPPEPGTVVEWREYRNKPGEDWDPTKYETVGGWTIPEGAKTVERDSRSNLYSSLLVTPGALAGAALPADSYATTYAMVADDLTGDQLEGIRNAVADHRFEVSVFSYNTAPDLNGGQATYVAIRTGLYAGSIFTLLLAGISLLVLALEHIRERRRQLAMLAASGVPRGVLGRSLLWQVALPIGLGVVMALVTGIGLAALVMRLTSESLTVDWSGVALLCLGAVMLSLLVSAMTLPFLRSATRLTALRTE